jgi:hypothetical protein
MYWLSGWWIYKVLRSFFKGEPSQSRPGDETPYIQERYPWETRSLYFFKVMFKLGFVVFTAVFLLGIVLMRAFADPLNNEITDWIARIWVAGMIVGIAMVVIGFIGMIVAVPTRKRDDDENEE